MDAAFFSWNLCQEVTATAGTPVIQTVVPAFEKHEERLWVPDET